MRERWSLLCDTPFFRFIFSNNTEGWDKNLFSHRHADPTSTGITQQLPDTFTLFQGCVGFLSYNTPNRFHFFSNKIWMWPCNASSFTSWPLPVFLLFYLNNLRIETIHEMCSHKPQSTSNKIHILFALSSADHKCNLIPTTSRDNRLVKVILEWNQDWKSTGKWRI